MPPRTPARRTSSRTSTPRTRVLRTTPIVPETIDVPLVAETNSDAQFLEELFEPASYNQQQAEASLATQARLALDSVVDIPAPEPVEGSPFQRRGMAECIVDDHDDLTKYKLYRIEELSDNTDDFLIVDDTGNPSFYPSTFFRACDHGPFRIDDTVKVLSVDSVIDENSKQKLLRDYIGSLFNVVEMKDDTVLCLYSDLKCWFRNTQVKLVKRNRYLDANPFKKGDLVKAVKNDKRGTVNIGEVYTVVQAKGDLIYLAEKRDYHYYHTVFVKHVRKLKKKAKFTLGDHIRRIVNNECYDKIDNVVIHAELKDAKLIGDDVTVGDISKFTEGMFSW